MNLFSEEMLNTFNASILPTNEACLLPREIYTSEEFFRFEKEAIFSGNGCAQAGSTRSPTWVITLS